MRKYLFLIMALLVLALAACSRGGLTGENPPKVMINNVDETYETKLGTYCWKSGCVDTVGPVELLDGKEPIKVKPGAVLTLKMDYNPKPNSIHLRQFTENEETEIALDGNQFTAPNEKGIYYYSYGVWWMDEKRENVSKGDASYYFSLEVE